MTEEVTIIQKVWMAGKTTFVVSIGANARKILNLKPNDLVEIKVKKIGHSVKKTEPKNNFRIS